MINWFNSNQGFVMIILTTAYVLFTGIIVYYNRKTINEMKITRENELRPYIFGQFTKFYDYGKIVDFQIRNSGKTGGVIKKITVSPELKLSKTTKGLKSLENFILAPNQSLSIQVFALVKDLIDINYEIHIEYQAINSTKIFTEDYKIPFIAYSLSGYSYTHEGNNSKEEDALINIASILSSINKRI